MTLHRHHSFPSSSSLLQASFPDVCSALLFCALPLCGTKDLLCLPAACTVVRNSVRVVNNGMRLRCSVPRLCCGLRYLLHCCRFVCCDAFSMNEVFDFAVADLSQRKLRQPALEVWTFWRLVKRLRGMAPESYRWQGESACAAKY